MASDVDTIAEIEGQHQYVLAAMNEFNSLGSAVSWVEKRIEAGQSLLIDSGVFSLASEYARTQGVTLEAALCVPPEKMGGFDRLFDMYVNVLSVIGDRVWGYVEVDQGGRENKIKIRGKLESLGLRPIPVYHMLSDGWEYFDELAEQYDRICVGNIAQAMGYEKIRFLATIWERKQKYPHLWVHFLGLTPNQWLNAYPMESTDSSSWLAAVRWSGYIERAMLKGVGGLPRHFQYRLGDRGAWAQGRQMGVYGANLNQRNWQNHLRTMEEE